MKAELESEAYCIRFLIFRATMSFEISVPLEVYVES